MSSLRFMAALVLAAGGLLMTGARAAADAGRDAAAMGTSAGAAVAPVPLEKRDPWTAQDLVEPAVLAKELGTRAKPTVLCVGMAMLYRSDHIPGAIYAGPAMNEEGRQKLKAAAKDLPREAPVVIYCGCCPWTHCPNIRPAFQTLRELGFKAVKVLVLPENFHDDWAAKGLPTEKGN